MQAGRLRHRVTIQNFTTSRTPSGQPVEKWEDGKTIWAEVKVTIEDAQIQWSAEEDEAIDSGDPFAGLEAALLAASQ
ncbi:phage head closure protein [Klebsiella michiganensis]|uniref:phage head closure protein n=1 Tax=Klebsiella michiganensis TaxID=1134687 RepID=UPI001D186186|nr:phage head closure protein [Klebsiella michiganensis]